MFRKKDTETDVPATGEAGFRRPAGDAAKSAPQPELRRKVELSSGAPSGGAAEMVGGLPTAQTEADRYGKRLIVGKGIKLSGEISSCDRLVVEGEVEVTLNDTLALEIASSGRFTGGCEVEEADISGVYEGDLTVRKHLCVRGTGKLTGTIRYAQLELERGGQIAGNISVLSSEGGASTGSSTGAGRATERRPAPTYGDTGSGSEQRSQSA
jgi:cytoskeletal protein CcmA (bactofilin family)